MNIERKLRSLEGNYAIQGEMIGEGIQGNKLKLKGQTVRFFNAFDIDRSEYLPMDGFVELFNKLQLPTVPVLSTVYSLGNDIASIVKMATIKSSLHADAWAEGIVIRPLMDTRNVLLSNEHFNSSRVTFKAINPEFLLKYGE